MNKVQLKLEIDELKCRLASLEKELEKPDNFEFKYTDTSKYSVITRDYVPKFAEDEAEHLNNYDYRCHRKNAELAYDLVRETKLIGALADQIQKNPIEPQWAVGFANYEIQLDTRTDEYTISAWKNYRTLGAQYMDKITAEKVCEILNSGRVKL